MPSNLVECSIVSGKTWLQSDIIHLSKKRNEISSLSIPTKRSQSVSSPDVCLPLPVCRARPINLLNTIKNAEHLSIGVSWARKSWAQAKLSWARVPQAEPNFESEILGIFKKYLSNKGYKYNMNIISRRIACQFSIEMSNSFPALLSFSFGLVKAWIYQP